jgi:hypothetical protein
MKIKDAIEKVNQYLINTGLDSDTPTVSRFNAIADYIYALELKLESLEDIDEMAGKYKDLVERAIAEFSSHVESGSSIDYGTADKLRNEFEELGK